jgi:hypothetical protein
MLRIAREKGVAAKPKRTTEGIGRCLPHCHEELGFSSPWDLAMYLDELARRSQGWKGNVRLPSEKTPPGVRLAIGVRCKHCKGRGCHRDEMMGWGVVYRVAIRKRECAQHEAAPTTPAA